MPQHKNLVSIAVGAKYVPISEKSLRRYISQGKIRGYRVGPKLIRVDLAELDGLVKQIPAADGGDGS